MQKMKNRLYKLSRLVEKAPVFLSSWRGINPNAYYFTGVEDDAFAVLVTRKETIAYGFHEYGFADQSIPAKDMRKHFWKYLEKNRIKKLQVDESDGTFFGRLLEKKIKPLPVRTKFLKMRVTKDTKEKSRIAKAQSITKSCFQKVKNHLSGKTENHVAGLLELEARKRGVRFEAFPPIVAAGTNGAAPHHRPGNTRIKKSDPVVIDIGVKYQNYCADFTHTTYEGKDPVISDAINAVKEAFSAARKLAKIGAKGQVLSDAALEVIEDYGFKDHSFRKIGLRLGHHVGLEVHDGVTGLEEDVLRKGMVFTIEPGVYVQGKFGVRFEDIVIL